MIVWINFDESGAKIEKNARSAPVQEKHRGAASIQGRY
jgi:hypothetical protein